MKVVLTASIAKERMKKVGALRAPGSLGGALTQTLPLTGPLGLSLMTNQSLKYTSHPGLLQQVLERDDVPSDPANPAEV